MVVREMCVMGLPVVAQVHYVLTALKLRTSNDNHAKNMDRPILWLPHMLTMWLVRSHYA